jgi:N-methylhydantoinase B
MNSRPSHGTGAEPGTDPRPGDRESGAVGDGARAPHRHQTSSPLSLVTYEVVRSNLRDLVWEQRETITHLYRPPPATVAYRANATIHSGSGEPVFFGSGSLFLAAMGDAAVRQASAAAPDQLQLADGDVLMQDHVRTGLGCVIDTCVYAPVFLQGTLFAWVTSVVDHREHWTADEAVASQLCSSRPTKIVEAGDVREDLLRAWADRFRLAGTKELLLRSQVAAATTAHHRIGEIVRRYGADAVSATMRRVAVDTAGALTARLCTLPDGEWRESRYALVHGPGEPELSRVGIKMAKVGDRIRVALDGDGPPGESLRLYDDAFRACVLDALLPLLAWDQDSGGAGFARQVEFTFWERAERETSSPGATSTRHAVALAKSLAQHLAAKMLSASDLTRDHVYASAVPASDGSSHLEGVDSDRTGFAALLVDSASAATSASSLGDGIAAGDSSRGRMHPIHGVEDVEEALPLACIYRRKGASPGGHGQWRGGGSLTSTWIAHESAEVSSSSDAAPEVATPSLTPGLFGALPASEGAGRRASEHPAPDATRPGGLRRDGRAPAPPGSVAAEWESRFAVGGAIQVMHPPGEGFGDPLLRAPDAVALDVVDGRLSREDALEIYGVVLRGLEVDSEATLHLRQAERAQRLLLSRPPRRPVQGRFEDKARGALWTVLVGSEGSGGVLACAYCRQILSRTRHAYRWGCAELEIAPGPTPDPASGEVSGGDRGELGVRQYLCPRCATVLDSEICKPQDEPTDDVDIER